MSKNSKQDRIRALGQRSIASSSIFRSSNLDRFGKQDAQKNESHKGSSRVSLSDFLDRKLRKDTSLPNVKVKGKLRPFCSPFNPRDDDRSIDHQIGVKKEEERNSVIDQEVFEQFKFTGGENGDDKGSCDGVEEGSPSSLFGRNLSHVDGAETSKLNGGQLARKRKCQFEGADSDNHTTQKHSLALGADPKPKQKDKKERVGRLTSNKRPRPLYNHYANGSGWWDGDMEGVDTEEVGFGEIWEGVGSTTFGGIEWH